LNHLFQTPVGLVSLLLNIPLFIVGYRSMGRIFVFRSFLATVLFAVFIDILPVKAVTDDPLLGSVFGGVMLGIGLGFILRGGATTGGSDMVARMIHKRFQHISVGLILLAIDFCVVIAAGFLIDVKYALYALITIYLTSKLVDVMMEGFARQKACYVISLRYTEIKQALMDKLDRGITLIHAQGGYSGEERPVLLCLLSAQEVGLLKIIVRQVDETAFVFITDAHEVLGEGFSKLGE
jgi:uncharacterized membrane-anchored protein YitT (DUF2179 family)